ncbi:tetratricopeptide repeat protein [Archangium gephyra]|uniref:tetratricopeptide repeat protein n=1 Tax=Archangium gephyra TaxID=48 RepID=UPI0011C10BAB|nr:tetratricopeptide repeat protein [Archangium gephyra]
MLLQGTQWLLEALRFTPFSPLSLLLLLVGVLLALLLLLVLLPWLCWPYLGGMFPRLTASISPFLPIGLLLIALSGVVFLGFEWVLNCLWRSSGWGAGFRQLPMVGAFDWIWPWLPTLFTFFVLLLVGAVSLSRRIFHLATILVLLFVTLGVALHAAPSHFEAPPPANTSEAAPPPEERTTSQLAAERFEERVFAPLFHAPNAKPDVFTVGAFGLVLLLGYSWLDRLNLRRSLRPIHVASITDTRGKGPPEARPDLEQLMREHLHRNMPHTPPWLPGGTLQYWQDFAEKQSTRDDHWLMRAMTVALRLIQPPSGLELTCTLVRKAEPGSGAPVWGTPGPPPSHREHYGIRVQMVDLRTRQTLMARTIWSTRSIELAVEQAAYAAVERAFRECKTLPEWVHWEEDDGAALRMYHQGVRTLTRGACGAKPAQKARLLLQRAAKRSPGSALARLQLAEALEACGDYVGAIELYLNVTSRYPRLLVAKYRLASTCRGFRRWGQKMAEEAPTAQRPLARERLQQALTAPHARGLWRPTWLGRCFRLLPAELDTHCLDSLHGVLLNMARRALRQQGGVLRLLHWCLNATDRRLFWHTRLWPPRRQRDYRLATRSALRCVEWHQIELQSAQLRRANRGFSYQRPCLAGRRLWSRILAHRLTREVTWASRIPRNWLGAANFNLACLYALRLETGQRELLSLLMTFDPQVLHSFGDPFFEAYVDALGATDVLQPARPGTTGGSFDDRRRTELLALKALMDLATGLVWHHRRELSWRRHGKLLRTVVAHDDDDRRKTGVDPDARPALEAVARHVVDSHENVQKAIEHLSCSLRDPEGPFSSKTWKWLLQHPDLQALRPQCRFQAWERLIRPEPPPTGPVRTRLEPASAT